MKRFRLAHSWDGHPAGDEIEVDELTARRLYRQGKGRILGDVQVKQVKKRTPREKAEPTVEPEEPASVVINWQDEQSTLTADESEV